MEISEEILKDLLNESFEAGFYGCKDIQDNFVEDLVNRVKNSSSTNLCVFTICDELKFNRNQNHYANFESICINHDNQFYINHDNQPLEFRRQFMDVQNESMEDTSL